MMINRFPESLSSICLSVGGRRFRVGGLTGRYSAVIVKSLGHQFKCQWVRHAARFLQLGSLILEPDFDLRLVKAEFGSKPLTTFFGEVAAGVELSPEHGQLVPVERCPRPLVVRHSAVRRGHAARRRTARPVALSPGGFTRSRPCNAQNHIVIQARILDTVRVDHCFGATPIMGLRQPN